VNILEKAGEPWSRQKEADGSEVWIYLSGEHRTRAWAVPFYAEVETKGTSRTVTLKFRGGILQDTKWTEVSR
jgi:hypothetical protein